MLQVDASAVAFTNSIPQHANRVGELYAGILDDDFEVDNAVPLMFDLM
jgi:hypothetical protein